MKELLNDIWTWFHRKLTNIWIYFIALFVFTFFVIVAVYLFTPENLFSNFICYYLGINPVNGGSLMDYELRVILIAILGIFTFTGLLIAAFSSGVERYIERIREGRKRFLFLRNHHVMIGYNQYSPSIIEHILTDAPKSKMVILTLEDVKQVRTKLQASLSDDLEKRIIIYAGDGNTDKHISSLNLQKAMGVYIMVEEIEWDNQFTRSMMLLKLVARYAGNRSIFLGNLLPVSLFINEPSAYDLIQRIKVPIEYIGYKQSGGGEIMQNIDLHVSNFHENWARLLWSHVGMKKEDGNYVYDALDFEPLENTNKYVHLVIIGLNSMGRALLMEALRICHYPNYDEQTGKNKSVITIIDPQSDKYKEQLNAQFPFLNNQIEDISINYLASSVECDNVRNILKEWSYDNNQLLTIAICVSDPDTAMTLALSLPEEVYYHYKELKLIPKNDTDKNGKQIIDENPSRTRILIRQKVKTALTDIFIGKEDKYKRVKLFGAFLDGFDSELLKDDLAICINGVYSDYSDTLKNENGVDSLKEKSLYSNFPKWKEKWLNLQETSEMDKLATRYQIDHYRTLLGTLQRNDIDKKDNLLLKQLAYAEHRRWIAERTLAGWRQVKDKEKRVDDLKIHTCIISHTQLPDSELIKDINVIKYAPILHKFANSLHNKMFND